MSYLILTSREGRWNNCCGNTVRAPRHGGSKPQRSGSNGAPWYLRLRNNEEIPGVCRGLQDCQIQQVVLALRFLANPPCCFVIESRFASSLRQKQIQDA